MTSACKLYEKVREKKLQIPTLKIPEENKRNVNSKMLLPTDYFNLKHQVAG